MKHLSKPELLALLAEAKKSSLRDWLMILTAYSHGMRASEVTGLTLADLRDGYITVKRLKGSNKTVQPFVRSTNPVLDEAKGYAAYLPTVTGRVFPVCRKTFWEILKKHGHAAGLPDHLCHPHVLKHTCGKLAVKAGISLPDLQQYMGHRSLSSTGFYTKSDDIEASSAFAKAMGAHA